jgi:Streptomyces sporulation and cell division protein, SsgA
MDTVPASSITRGLALELLDANGTATPLAAELRYDKSDPYAVAACFLAGETQVQWVFARDLLKRGIHQPTGDGDVHIWPCLDTLGHAATIIELSSPDGEAVIQARTDELYDFLAEAETLVRSGTEADHVDVDSALVQLLI